MPTFRHRVPAAALCLALALAAACRGDAGAEERPQRITVFAAASLTDVFREEAAAFERAHPGITVDLAFGASSALREQILAGAPADAFASADSATMDALVDAHEVDGRPAVFAHNTMEIAVPEGNPGGIEGLDDFGDPGKLIGLCAAEVPCGKLGRQVLAAAGVTLAEDTDEPDVRSLLTKVGAGDLDAGLVYATDVQAAAGSVDGIAVPDAVNVTTDYPVATVAGSRARQAAAAFVAFLLSADGQAILTDAGFAGA